MATTTKDDWLLISIVRCVINDVDMTTILLLLPPKKERWEEEDE